MVRSHTHYHGVLPVVKPRGCTSHDVVAQLRKLLGERRIGHAGTLDPDAEGLLVICIGQATRIVSYLQSAEKEYEGVVRFGMGTNTDDATGEVEAWGPCPQLKLEDIEAVLPRLQGAQVLQQVPRYAAVRVQGQRLYELARGGIEVELPERPVRIDSLQVGSFQRSLFPELFLSVRCGKGTYIRSLARDLGKLLGVPAHLSFLRRTRSGWLTTQDAYTLPELTALAQGGVDWTEILLSLDEALASYPSVVIRTEDAPRVLAGWPLEDEAGVAACPPATTVRVYTEEGIFCALYRTLEDGTFKPEKVFSSCCPV